MVERTVTRPEARRMTDGAFQIHARRSERLFDRLPDRQIGGNRRRERAARTVRVPGRYPGAAEVELRVGRADDVDGVMGSEVPPLHYYDARSHGTDPPRRRPHVVDGGDTGTGEHLGFGDVRR